MRRKREKKKINEEKPKRKEENERKIYRKRLGVDPTAFSIET